MRLFKKPISIPVVVPLNGRKKFLKKRTCTACVAPSHLQFSPRFLQLNTVMEQVVQNQQAKQDIALTWI